MVPEMFFETNDQSDNLESTIRVGDYQLCMPEMRRDFVFSWIFSLIIGWYLWPPGAVYWSYLAEYVGQPVTLLVVGILASGFGFVFEYLTTVQIRPFVAGTVLAYLSGIIAIDTFLTPDSPVHLILYGGLVPAVCTGRFLGN